MARIFLVVYDGNSIGALSSSEKCGGLEDKRTCEVNHVIRLCELRGLFRRYQPGFLTLEDFGAIGVYRLQTMISQRRL